MSLGLQVPGTAWQAAGRGRPGAGPSFPAAAPGLCPVPCARPGVTRLPGILSGFAASESRSSAISEREQLPFPLSFPPVQWDQLKGLTPPAPQPLLPVPCEPTERAIETL